MTNHATHCYDSVRHLFTQQKLLRCSVTYLNHDTNMVSLIVQRLAEHTSYKNPVRVHALLRSMKSGTVLDTLRLAREVSREQSRKVLDVMYALYNLPDWTYTSDELYHVYRQSRWGGVPDTRPNTTHWISGSNTTEGLHRPSYCSVGADFSTVGVPFRWLLSVASQWDGMWSLRWEEPPRLSTFTNSVDTIDQSPIYGGIIDIPDTKDRTAYVVQLGATEQNVLYSLLDELSSHHGQKLLEEFESSASRLGAVYRLRNTAFIFTSDTFVYYYPHGRITMNNNVIAKTTTLDTAAIINALDEGEHELLGSLAATLSERYGYPVTVHDFRIENNHDDVIELWLCCEEVVPNGVLHDATRRNVRRGEEEHTLFGTEVRVQSEILYGSTTAGEVIEVIREGL